ncbi:outer membrane esterase [Xenorhabdus mauleonii]|uniref:Outer membrane esterase n=1 Tax=Xenorhabdus mauleonii TaxID=351675 RepID=A0A1I3QVA9_9GAMM|nr:autotransporter domain-containing protein [Xenorhabdus mauleonii]PHM38705.1 outer membrane esterase [Xenorhabdus mauleonii]SFJ38084.1 outer membrane lipase/esterase [Xenorhabdus mauleonii]
MKKTHLVLSTTTAFLLSFVSNAHAFDNVYVFGDSLSDGGNFGRFTTDGKNAELYDEYIAQQITNKKLTPSKLGGTNYAVAGSTASSSGGPVSQAMTTQRQVNEYLGSYSGKADPNSLYIHWVGGNDVADALVSFSKGNKKIAQQLIDNGSTSAASQVRQLIKAGAGLVIVPNVPDVGTTPKVLESVLTGALEKNKIPEKEIKEILKKTREAINKYPTPNPAIRDKIIDGVFKKIAEKAEPTDPNKAKEIYQKLLNAYEQNSKLGTQFSAEFNQKEDELLGNGNILRADVNRLLKEVIKNPFIYGITNTLGYACPQGQYAMFCHSSNPNFDKNQLFLFSDSFHPTPDAHKVVGQYIMSIYYAPYLVMALNQINQAPTNNVLSALDGHLQQLRNSQNPQGKMGVFGGYTGNHDDTFTLGSDYQLTDNLLLGLTVSRAQAERNAVPHFSYAANSHVMTAYALWNYNDNGWLSSDVHYSHTSYDYLSRAIQLGQATRREFGSTDGKQWGWRITAGWNIPVTNYLTTSPVIQYAWDKGNIDGYRESGDNSTSMHFGSQRYNSRVGSVGWRVDTQLGLFNPYASILFTHKFNGEHYALRSAINSTRTSFVQKEERNDKNYFQYSVGVNANFTNNFRAFAAVSHAQNNNAPSNNYNVNLGFNFSF